MSLLKTALEQNRFAITAEMAPPKGYDFSEQLETAALLKDCVHGVNVTDMQSACLKASSLGLCIQLKQAGLEPILQITGRDRNRMAIMADILSAASFGIDTMLALTGDHPVVGDCKQSKPVYDLDSVGILNMLSKMEQTNTDCGGNALTGGAPKNITNQNDVSILRKLREIFSAMNLEEEYTKDEILEYYLNLVHFGSGCNGVQAAANLYFGKDIQDCSIAECASIAGITQNPYAFTPILFPENNKGRQQIVLSEMYSQGYITKAEYDEAMEESENMNWAFSQTSSTGESDAEDEE